MSARLSRHIPVVNFIQPKQSVLICTVSLQATYKWESGANSSEHRCSEPMPVPPSVVPPVVAPGVFAAAGEVAAAAAALALALALALAAATGRCWGGGLLGGGVPPTAAGATARVSYRRSVRMVWWEVVSYTYIHAHTAP
ncbi:hypothetical protein Vretifemale_12719 [Volvox reticuliferus]|uniref:Uncharacterized protein n=1 Tax=Volvox reticuliferus TaxID=1737510 RepID=A0A8J4CPF8_9CHLO|nr:hypothetical protein Vretifemale_12719 [Volvox reticuliferus]